MQATFSVNCYLYMTSQHVALISGVTKPFWGGKFPGSFSNWFWSFFRSAGAHPEGPLRPAFFCS